MDQDLIFRTLGLTPFELQSLQKIDPVAYADALNAISFEQDEKDREVYEDSLLEFFKRAWREMDPATLSVNWHHERICEALEDITFGINRNLIINIPPRHTKTLIANVLWPAWTWCRGETLPLSGPHVKFLCVSYGATLAEEIALKMRRLIMGDWYQRLWGHRVKLQEDQKNRANFENVAGGARISNSIEGGILGRGGDITICDDPQTRRGADSEIERAESLRGMSDLTTRVTDPRIHAQVLVMQRLHEQDATDWALKNWPQGQMVRRDDEGKPYAVPRTIHLMYPARFDPGRACIGDPRMIENELMWPEVWTEDELAKIEAGLAALDGEMLSDYAISGQLQQLPIPRAGGIINQDDWEVWPEWIPSPEDVKITPDGRMYVAMPEVSHVVLALDTALSEKETADWNAIVIIGIWHRPRKLTQIVGQDDVIDDGEQPRAILMGAWRGRRKLNDDEPDRDGVGKGVVQRVIAMARQFNVDRIIIENKTRGLDVKNEIERQFFDAPYQIQLFDPRKHGDKVTRLNSVQPLFNQRLIYSPANCYMTKDFYGNPTVAVREFQWVKMVVDEIASVPRGTHDDLADACSMSLLQLRDEGFLTLTQEYIAAQMSMRMFKRKRSRIREGYGV